MKMLKNKKIEKYDFSKKPRTPWLLMWIVQIACAFKRLGRKTKVHYVTKKSKRPSLVLGTHAAFNDFYMLFKIYNSPKINYVVAIDAFNDIGSFLMDNIGAICKRKFIQDLSLMKNLKYSVEELKNNVVIYPEARYSLDGTTSYLPPSLGKLAKFLGIPVTVINLKGSYISDPQWNKYKQNRMPMEAYVEEILTAEEVATLSVDEINQRIKKAFEYDDWKWLKESGVKLTYKNRATNLNAILYQCPNCKKEFEMEGSGITLKCNACRKSWEMATDGSLTATAGETEFSHVPDWFKWQKQNVHDEVFGGRYKMEADCDVYTLPSSKGFVSQGKGKLIQTPDKTVLKVNLYGEDKVIEYLGTELESVHVEYKYKDCGDMLDFSIPGDSIWMHPTNRKDILTKVSLATEEIRDLAKSKLNN